MADAQQLQQDLSFVREAVLRRERMPHTPAAIAWVWAAYVLIGYTLIDVAPRWAGWFFMIGGIGGGVLSAFIGHRVERRVGEVDRAHDRRMTLHWLGGIVLAVVSTFALACVIPPLRSSQGSQVLVVMIGIVYFLAGVHYERHYLWLGPVLIVGGVAVGFFPHYGWTSLGIVIAIGLVVPTLLKGGNSADAPAE